MASDQVVLSPEKVTVDPSLEGFHNMDLSASRSRVLEGGSYRDCSTVALLPTPKLSGALHYKVSAALKGMLSPMNQKFHLQYLEGMEVADAYNHGIQWILQNPELSKWKFVLTIEHDNTPPPDGLVKVLETMIAGPWAGVGGLYWTKGEGGMPMIYGDPKDPIPNFRPLAPELDAVQECRGLAMGFTLWDMDLFKDNRLPTHCVDPKDLSKGATWFRTLNDWTPSTGVRAGTQDLDFCGRAGALGYRFCVDTRVKVGHVQFEATPTHPAGFVW